MTGLMDQIRTLDYQSYLFFHNAIHGRPWLNSSYLFFAKYGIVFVFLSFVYLIWRRRPNTFVCASFATIIAIFFDTVILLFWKRPRPFVSHHEEVLFPITQGLRVSSVSFPSAHTYVAFAIATSVYLYGHKKLGIFLYLLALAIAFGRVGAGLHYPSDILGGALIGIASGVIGFRLVSKAEVRWE